MKEIQLTKGYTTIVDDEDYEYLIKFKWQYSGGYAIHSYRDENGNTKKIWMHRLILNTPKNMITDHINHNRLDNRRSNIRICTHSENNKNVSPKSNSSSKYLGVYKVNLKDSIRYRSVIRIDGKAKAIGTFRTENEAALAYNEYAKKYHGEFANLNIIE